MEFKTCEIETIVFEILCRKQIKYNSYINSKKCRCDQIR